MTIMETSWDDDDDTVVVVIPHDDNDNDDEDDAPVADSRLLPAVDDDDGATVTVTPNLETQSQQEGPQMANNLLLAEAIQNTLTIQQQKTNRNNDGPDNPRDDIELEDSTRQGMEGNQPLSPSPTAAVAAAAAAENDPDDKNENKSDGSTTKPQPSLWKLAGRAIRKHKVGKTILHGIRDGTEVTKKALGIGAGHISIFLPETRVYQPEEVVTGMVKMELTEPIVADRLLIRLQGVAKESSEGQHSKVVHKLDYRIGGKQEYPCQGDFPFEFIVPRLQCKMSQETRSTTVGSIISAVQSVSAAMKSPVEWSLTATLIVPGRLVSMSETVRIHVAEGEY